jgi:uncharacterized protein (TIGR02246 family)
MNAISPEPEPSTVAREVLGHLESAWNNADGTAFGSLYTPDASFVTIRGEHLVGGPAIGRGHAAIFASIYAGSVSRMELVRAEEISSGGVLAISLNTLDCPSGPLAGTHRAMSTSVIARDSQGGGPWRLVATHNTLITA